MNNFKIIAAAVLVSAAGSVFAAEPTSYDSTRQQRMDEALDHYREGQGTNSTAKPNLAERGANALKRGAHKTGNAIERGAKAVGHAVGTGLHKTGDALQNGGERLQEKTAQ